MRRQSARILLPDGCSCSQLTVHPENWKQKGASISQSWHIGYRFYSPGGTRQILIRKMNKYKTLSERRAATQALLETELELLESGFNPIKGVLDGSLKDIPELNPSSPLISALNSAALRIKCEDNYRQNVRSVLKYFSRAARCLDYDQLEVGSIRRRHIRLVLDECVVICFQIIPLRSLTPT